MTASSQANPPTATRPNLPNPYTSLFVWNNTKCVCVCVYIYIHIFGAPVGRIFTPKSGSPVFETSMCSLHAQQTVRLALCARVCVYVHTGRRKHTKRQNRKPCKPQARTAQLRDPTAPAAPTAVMLNTRSLRVTEVSEGGRRGRRGGRGGRRGDGEMSVGFSSRCL